MKRLGIVESTLANRTDLKKQISLFFTQAAVIDSVTVNQPDDVKLTTGNERHRSRQLVLERTPVGRTQLARIESQCHHRFCEPDWSRQVCRQPCAYERLVMKKSGVKTRNVVE